ncbi:MAG: UPF0164 family protein [Melioribacteraceae bacterium]|nr:UPF0164 family protein [Melioribacteraceae bacterium]
MMRKKIQEILLLFLMISLTAYAQESDQVGTSMANFLKIDVGSRASALGGAFVAMADDASATYWNPGGLVNVKKNEAMFQSTNWVADTKTLLHGCCSSSPEMGYYWGKYL